MPTSLSTPVPGAVYAGPLMVALGAMLFSTKAVVVKCAYPYGVDALTLLTLRMGFSMPIFVALAWWCQRHATERLPLGLLARCCGLGVIGYYLSSLLDFQGLVFIGVGLERIVLCLYPVLVVVGGAILFGQPLNRRVLAALSGCLLGIVLTCAGMPMRTIHIWSGTLLIACSAISYAAFVLGSGQLLRTLGAQRFMAIAMTASCVAVLGHFLLRALVVPQSRAPWHILHLQPAVYGYGLFLACAGTVAPALLMGEGLKRVGSQRFVIISAIGPAVTILLGWLVLGEAITALNALGMALTVAASAATGLAKPETPTTPASRTGDSAPTRIEPVASPRRNSRFLPTARRPRD